MKYMHANPKINDIERLREDTPGSRNKTHLNNAGSSFLSMPTIMAMRDYQDLENSVGGYEAAQVHSQSLYQFKQAASHLIGVRSETIAEMNSATHAWQTAFAAVSFRPGDRIITHAMEYGSNYLAIIAAKSKYDLHVDILKNSTDGIINLDELKSMITPRTRLISVTHVAAHTGVVQPVNDIGKMARDHGVLYFLDSCQALGQFPVNAKTIGCDVMCATGRKFIRGPRGTGFLYASNEFSQAFPPSIADLQSASISSIDGFSFSYGAQRYETWEKNIANRIGITRAMEYAQSLGVHVIAVRLGELVDYIKQSIQEIPGIETITQGDQWSSILAVKLDKPAELVKDYLAKNDINISIVNPSAAPLDTSLEHIPSIIRVSPHYYNTKAEIDYFLHVLSNRRDHIR